jgi:two-component system chemotaxis response regulator CheY
MSLKLDNISVLVVEDMKPMRMIVTGLLEKMGVGKVWSEDNAVSALDVVRKNNPDIVITDWHMEPISGVELTKSIRSDVTIPNRLVPIIMITGFNAMQRVAIARDQGVTEFLIKPFSAQEFARRIAYVINKPRNFIECRGYFGPDRRRQVKANYDGPKKRKSDNAK